MQYIIFITFFLLTSIAAQDAPLPEGIKNDQNPNDKTITPLESLKKITVPKGFNVKLFDGEPDLSQPIAFTFDDRGRLWVVQNFSHPYYKKVGHDRVLILEDKDGDGEFDERKVFWDKGQYVTGIQYGHGGIWICNSPNLQFIPDANGDDIPDSEPITVLDGWNFKGKNNVVNNLNWGPDGWLYGLIGQNDQSMIGAPGTPLEERIMISRGIWRYHPVTKKFEVVSRGAVNPWGLDFDDHGEGFFTNCVLPHAWHLIPGAYYQRRGNETDFQDIYGRIPPIADHLHWAGGHWTSWRNAKGAHSDMGGGHAHTGAMIYMGGNWPRQYRGTLFVGNIHGNRINNDFLSRQDSSYVASHGKDFLFGNHLWFRSLAQKYGPDGGVFITDWHDYGECHDNDGTHRTSGRIYKITYGKTKHQTFDLQKYSNKQLAKLQLHENEWFVRHARRVLHERAAAGNDMLDAKEELKKLLKSNLNIPKTLRVIWCQYLIGDLNDAELAKKFSHKNEHIRTWAMKLIFDDQKVSEQILDQLSNEVSKEKSSLFRLHLSGKIQRLTVKERSKILLNLVQQSQDKNDRTIPKMLYYAAMDIVSENPTTTSVLLARSQIPLFTEYLSRLITTRNYDYFQSETLLILSQLNDELVLAGVKGVYQALIRKSDPQMPENWSTFYKNILSRNNQELTFNTTLLALKFKDKSASKALKKIIISKALNPGIRLKSLDALIKSNDPELFSILTASINDPHLRENSIKGLAVLQNDEIPQLLFAHFSKFNAAERAAVFTTLCSREEFALKLFEEIEAKRLPATSLSSFHIRQIQAFKNDTMNKRLKKIWGDIKQQSTDKKKEISRLQKLLSKRFIADGDFENGKKVYTRTCGACHTLFGEGGKIGPDLTGSGRKDLFYLLENIIDPSAIVSKNFQYVTLKAKDGRILSGTIAEESGQTVTIATLNDTVIVKRDDIEKLTKSKQSLMPEGLLKTLSKNEMRDLFKYLQK